MQAEVGHARRDHEKLSRLALEWFGDLGNPQPQERATWPGKDARNLTPLAAVDDGVGQPRFILGSSTFRTPDWGRLPRLDDDEPPGDTRAQVGGDQVRGITVPTALAEEAVRLHARDGLGRRTLEVKLPGLGEWGARGTLYWYKVGRPAGLWLDEDNRPCWGPAITPVWNREQDRGAAEGCNCSHPCRAALAAPLKPA